MEHYLSLFAKAVFVENMALAFFLGMCSFLACSKKVSNAAGLGIAYHAKPKAAAAADAAVRVGDLTVLLWAQGVPRAEWAEG